MKFKTLTHILILILTTFIGFWSIPQLVETATYSPDKYPFVYYSSVLKKNCLIDFRDEKYPMKDVSGKTYNQQQFDTLLPLFNFRQLAADGRLPKQIDGLKIDMPLLHSKNVVYRFDPSKFSSPDMGAYIMYESMPKRVDTDTPEDIFRFTNKIEFVDAKTNKVNHAKSMLFQMELEVKGYRFPTQWLSGNMNPMKPYDEGFFSLDAAGKLFHIKMVNERPFIRDTQVDKTINVANFTMLEMADKRFYGFIYDRKGNVYILEESNGTYKPIQLQIDPVDAKVDEILIMGNLLYWNVTVTKPNKQIVYALKTKTLERVATYITKRDKGMWDTVSSWLFPMYIRFEHKYITDFIYPIVNFTSFYALIFNLILAIGYYFLCRNSKQKRINSIYILVTGAIGLTAILILPSPTE